MVNTSATFGEFWKWKNNQTTLGSVGGGATQNAIDNLSPSIVSLINQTESETKAVRITTLIIAGGWSATGNAAAGWRWGWNPDGASADFAMAFIAAELPGYKVLNNKLKDFVAQCDKDGK